MDALDALHSRCSVAQLTEPGPDPQQLENILLAGLRANDHRQLRPWKFLVIEGCARERLGELMVRIAREDDPDLAPQQCSALAEKALRAPLLVLIAAAVRLEHEAKVPVIEQILSAGAAAQMMMLAAHVQGIGAIWRTGAIVYDARFKKAMGLSVDDHIVGMLYMGTPTRTRSLQRPEISEFVERWRG